jgi:hypothetical protein
MSRPPDNPARRWAADLRDRRAWGGFRWHRFRSRQMYGRDRREWGGYRWSRFRSWLTYGRASTPVFAAAVILGSIGLVGLLTMGRGSAPRQLGGAFTIGVTDEGVPYIVLDPQGLGQAQGAATKDGAIGGSGPLAVTLFPVDTSGGVLSLVGGEGSSVGNDPQPQPGPNPGPNPSPVPSPGPSPSPTPPPTTTEPPPTSTEPPPTSTEPPPTSTEPPPTSTEPPPTSTEPPPTSTEPPPTSTEPPPTSTEPPPTSTEPPEPSSD